MQSVSIAGKHATDAKRGKTHNPCHARENIQPVSCAGKHTTVSSAGKQTTSVKRGKTENLLSTENMGALSSAGKITTRVKRG